MPHFEELYPGRFLKGVTLTQPKTVRIKGMVGEVLESADDEGTPKADKPNKPKAILRYMAKEGPGEMVLCKTNAACIAAMFGDDYAGWVDHLVTFYFDASVRFGSEKPGGIRVAGSPELTKTLRVNIRRPRRKKPDVYDLAPTTTPRQMTPAQLRQAGATHHSDLQDLRPTTREAETPSGRFLRLLTDAPDIATVDRIMDDVAATLTDAELTAAQKFANVRREALAGRSE